MSHDTAGCCTHVRSGSERSEEERCALTAKTITLLARAGLRPSEGNQNAWQGGGGRGRSFTEATQRSSGPFTTVRRHSNINVKIFYLQCENILQANSNAKFKLENDKRNIKT